MIENNDAIENNAALEKLQARLGVKFKDIERLRRAMTHRSAAAVNPFDSNERLEFFGDSIVGFIVAEDLFKSRPDFTEGDLAKSKSYLVSSVVFAEAARTLGLDQFVILGASEDAGGGRNRRGILADAFEALIASIYLECGLATTKRVVKKLLKAHTAAVTADTHRCDAKSALQERTQADYRLAPTYPITEEGKEHQKMFRAEARLGKRIIGIGRGGTKKEAEQNAAQDAMKNLSETPLKMNPPDKKKLEDKKSEEKEEKKTELETAPETAVESAPE